MDLYLARAKRRISQIQLAMEIGTSQSRISLIERGYLVPDDAEKARISKILGVSIDAIDWPVKGAA